MQYYKTSTISRILTIYCTTNVVQVITHMSMFEQPSSVVKLLPFNTKHNIK